MAARRTGWCNGTDSFGVAAAVVLAAAVSVAPVFAEVAAVDSDTDTPVETLDHVADGHVEDLRVSRAAGLPAVIVVQGWSH